MASVRLSDDLDNRLSALSSKTKRPKSYYVKRALESFLVDEEFYSSALETYEEHLRLGGKTYTLEEAKKLHGNG
ncbi:MAG: ribbon-helix-helix domain-containing protein [Alphaproteobacteria bacterium]